jgi:iron-sulfur cluster assembly accessory protein
MVTLTDSARDYMRRVSDGQYVTLGVKGGGCSGFQYIWGLSEKATYAHEQTQWLKPVDDILLLDPLAEMYVVGSEIDYVEELGNSSLRVVNPKATSTCGCGESFNAG